MNMMTAKTDAVVPTQADAGLAEEASRILASLVQGDELRVHLDDGRVLTLPRAAAPLRDLLMRLALTDLFRAKWTDAIHEEWITNALKDRPNLTRTQVGAEPRPDEQSRPGRAGGRIRPSRRPPLLSPQV